MNRFLSGETSAANSAYYLRSDFYTTNMAILHMNDHKHKLCSKSDNVQIMPTHLIDLKLEYLKIQGYPTFNI